MAFIKLYTVAVSLKKIVLVISLSKSRMFLFFIKGFYIYIYIGKLMGEFRRGAIFNIEYYMR